MRIRCKIIRCVVSALSPPLVRRGRVGACFASRRPPALFLPGIPEEEKPSGGCAGNEKVSEKPKAPNKRQTYVAPRRSPHLPSPQPGKRRSLLSRRASPDAHSPRQNRRQLFPCRRRNGTRSAS